VSLGVDAYVWLAPLLLLAVVALFAFVGCDIVYQLHDPTGRPPDEDIRFVQVLVDRVEMAATSAVAAPYTGAVTAGNLLVLWVWYHTTSAQTVLGVTDAAGNVFAPADGELGGTGNLATGRQQVWYAKNAVEAPAGTNVTVTFSGAVTPNLGVGVFEYTKPLAEPFVDAKQGFGFGDVAESPAVTPANARMLFGAVMFGGEGTNDPVASQRLIQRGNVAEDYLSRPVQTQIFGRTTNPDNQDWIAQVVAFK
jgi:hypothetical protein